MVKHHVYDRRGLIGNRLEALMLNVGIVIPGGPSRSTSGLFEKIARSMVRLIDAEDGGFGPEMGGSWWDSREELSSKCYAGMASTGLQEIRTLPK